MYIQCCALLGALLINFEWFDKNSETGTGKVVFVLPNETMLFYFISINTSIYPFSLIAVADGCLAEKGTGIYLTEGRRANH